MVNVFKIKKGDTVKFRNGEVHTVTEAKTYEDYGYEYGEDWEKKQFLVIWIDRNLGGRVDFTYGNFGGSYYSTGQSAWDIVEHIPNQGEEEPTQDETAIRDKFASDYIQQLNVWPEGYAMGHHAKRAYEYADAMMKARKENN